jgi:5-methylcytosine-specific restriction enzyme A
MYLQRGVVQVATIANHIEPHRDDWNKFLTGKLQSLCFDCHNRDKAYIDKHGHARVIIGVDGWPIEPS